MNGVECRYISTYTTSSSPFVLYCIVFNELMIRGLFLRLAESASPITLSGSIPRACPSGRSEAFCPICWFLCQGCYSSRTACLTFLYYVYYLCVAEDISTNPKSPIAEGVINTMSRGDISYNLFLNFFFYVFPGESTERMVFPARASLGRVRVYTVRYHQIPKAPYATLFACLIHPITTSRFTIYGWFGNMRNKTGGGGLKIQ